MVEAQAHGIPLPGSTAILSPIGLGTWAWGDSSTWGMGGYDSTYGPGTIREAYQASVSAGVTFLDTAEMYGKGESERIIGKLLADDSVNRARVVIGTKFMPFPWRVRLTAEILGSLRASLERLGMPHVPLYQIHGPTSLRSHAAMAEALAEAKRQELLETVGVSNYSESEMRAIHRELEKRGVPLATNQIEYSLLRTLPESTGLLRACHELGVIVLAYSRLAQGRLTGKYDAAHPPAGKRNFSDFPMREIEPVVAELRAVGERHGRTPAQVALNWLVCVAAHFR